MIRFMAITFCALASLLALEGAALSDTMVAAECVSTGTVEICEAICPAGHVAVSGRGRICEPGVSNFELCILTDDDQGPVITGFDGDVGTPISGDSTGWYCAGTTFVGFTTVVYAHCAPETVSIAAVPGLSGLLALVDVSCIVGLASSSRLKIWSHRSG